jgi:glycosyltransferase involved in cell wall biosynthesis
VSDVPPQLTVCVFAWNEVETIRKVIDEVRASVDRIGAPAEIIVIDDGSTDGTGEASDEAARADLRVRVVHHGDNRGLGGIYRTGFDEARGDFITFFPGDAQFPASIAEDFFPRMRDHDMVLGYLPQRPGIVGAVLSRVERVLYRVLVGPMPRFQGILMFRRSLLAELPLKSSGRGWAILMELILRVARADKRIVSVPTSIRPREVGTSKVNNIRNIRANLQQVVRLRRLIESD